MRAPRTRETEVADPTASRGASAAAKGRRTSGPSEVRARPLPLLLPAVCCLLPANPLPALLPAGMIFVFAVRSWNLGCVVPA